MPRGLRVSQLGGSSEANYVFPTSGATDVWNFNVESGNIVSSILGNTYVPTGAGTLLYQQPGPGTLKGVIVTATTMRLNSSVGTAFNLSGAQNFSIVYQEMNPVGATLQPGLLDFSTDAVATPGVYIEHGPANIRCFVVDDSLNVNSTIFAAASWPFYGLNFWNADQFHTVRWVFDRSRTDMRLFVKKEGALEEEILDIIPSGTAISAMGAITFSTTDKFTFLGNNINGSSPYSGNLYQAAFAKNTTYDPPLKP